MNKQESDCSDASSLFSGSQYSDENDDDKNLDDANDGGGNDDVYESDKTEINNFNQTEGTLLPIFPDRSVNLLCSASNSGKSYMLAQILKHRHLFFGNDSVKSILYINCNLYNSGSDVENPFSDIETDLPPLTVVNLADLDDVTNISHPKQVVILDDVVYVNDVVTHYVTYAANHMDLIVFVVTQGCLSEKLYRLIYKVHNLIVFLTNSSSISLCNNIKSRFFLSDDKKQYLKEILARAERGKQSLVLKLNSVASSPDIYKKIFAFSNIEQLFQTNNRHCLVYPELGEKNYFVKMDLPENLDPETLVLVPAKHVIKQSEASSPLKCTKSEKWQKMIDEVSEEIRSSFDVRKWKDVFIIFKEILKVEDFCISSDYRTLFIKSRKTARTSLIDFLTIVTRRSHPAESPDKLLHYVPFLKLLLKNKIPSTFIKNQKLLELSHSGKRARNAKKDSKIKRPAQPTFRH